ncbi:MAG: TIGR04086 family membrane protein [Clostridia bacterium]|nr:TIGR04086 family membrane protein [Clostridia bacterium]
MENKGNVFLIIKGVLFGYLFTIIQILGYSIVLANTAISEKTIPICVFVFSVLSVFISSSIVCIKIKENGLKNGGLIGLFYILIVYFIGSILSGNFVLTTYSITTIIFNILLRNGRGNCWSKYGKIIVE